MIKKVAIGRRGGARPDRKRKAVLSSKEDMAIRPLEIRIRLLPIKFKSEVRYPRVYFGYQMCVSHK